MAKKVFSSILSESPAPAPAAAATPRKAAKAGRPSTSQRGSKVEIFHLDDDLLLPLTRLVFWRVFEADPEKGGTRREVINDALRALAAADPTAQKLMPSEPKPTA